MLTEIYIEALLVDEDLADQGREAPELIHANLFSKSRNGILRVVFACSSGDFYSHNSFSDWRMRLESHIHRQEKAMIGPVLTPEFSTECRRSLISWFVL